LLTLFSAVTLRVRQTVGAQFKNNWKFENLYLKCIQ